MCLLDWFWGHSDDFSPKKEKRRHKNLCYYHIIQTVETLALLLYQPVLTNDWPNSEVLHGIRAGNWAICPPCAVLRGEWADRSKPSFYIAMTINWSLWSWRNSLTYWETVGGPRVTKAKAAMKENISVFISWQEKHSREKATLRPAVLCYGHVLAVCGTPVKRTSH